MSKGQPAYECTNGCTTPVARRGMCPACAAERRAAQVWVRDVTAEIRVACGVELPQHVELLSPLPVMPVMPVAAPESPQEPREVRKAAPDMAAVPVSARERLGLKTETVPPAPPKYSPDMARHGRVVAARRAAEERYHALKAWIPAEGIWTEADAVAACGRYSRNVVRVTLRRLQAEGVIRVIPCRGWAAAGWVEPETPVARAIRVLREHGPMQMAELARRTGIPGTTLRKALHASGRTRIEDGRVSLRGGA